MDFKKLRYFAVAATEGSFHAASAKLHVAQPALSRQIRYLEEEIGADLFIRYARGVRLSRAGAVLLAEVQRLLPQIELAKDMARRAAIGQFGVLRIGLSNIIAQMRFAIAAIADAGRTNSELDYRVSMISSDHQIAALEIGDIDIGLLYRRGKLPPNLRYRDLRIDHYALAVPDGHRLTRLPEVTLADIGDEKMLFVSRTQWPLTHEELMRAWMSAGLMPNIVLELEGEDAMWHMVAEGMALGIFNSAMGARRPNEGVTFLRVADLAVPLNLAAIWNGDQENPAIDHFVDLVSIHLEREAS